MASFEFTTGKIVLIVITILIVLILFCCVCGGGMSCGSSDCGSSDCLKKKKCGSGKYCKKCGCIPCSCNSADICSVTRTLVSAGVSGSSADEYMIVVEGSGLNAVNISSVEFKIDDTSIGNNDYFLTYTPTDVSTGQRLVYAPSGYSMNFMFTTGNIGDNTGPPIGPATSGNMSPTLVYSLVGTVLTITVQMALAV